MTVASQAFWEAKAQDCHKGLVDKSPGIASGPWQLSWYIGLVIPRCSGPGS